ncbi:MAG: prepilin-type N-terminal cleavage/methylation domain-containing protein [Candidatus Gracilibacteria bacterium]|nr:prepilin-type N-terminal cleavage/methylation domain-containing protein [Candidatus Gracilibacteria bacterium]
MFTLKNSTRGFTLIELLVVITIIGILATGATATYTSQIQKARDTTRINDVKALQGGIEQSYQDISEYPRGSTLQVELAKYLGKIPTDSKYAQPCNDGGTAENGTDCAYAYIAGPDNNGILYGEYEVSTAFENLGNVQNKAATDGGGATLSALVRLESGLDVANNSTLVAKDSITGTTKGVVNAAGTALAAAADDTSVVIINGQ